VRSIIKNQRAPTITAVAIPAPKPNLVTAIGTTNGKTKVPANGVKATNKRKAAVSMYHI